MTTGIKQHKLRPWGGKTFNESLLSCVFSVESMRHQRERQLSAIVLLWRRGTPRPCFRDLRAFPGSCPEREAKILREGMVLPSSDVEDVTGLGAALPPYARHCDWSDGENNWASEISSVIWAITLCETLNCYVFTSKMKIIIPISWGCWEVSRNIKQLT